MKIEGWEIEILVGGFAGLLGVLTQSFLWLYVGFMVIIAGVLRLVKIKFDELSREAKNK